MQKPTFDPGLTQKYTGDLRRAINQDGEFNVRKTGVTWHDFHPYLFLIRTPWTVFFGIVFVVFLFLDVIFAGIYSAIGLEQLHGSEAPTQFRHFLNAVFFSAHTLTTVGYGNIYPDSIASNTIAAVEAMVGLMMIALATGLLFGRVSRPSARIGFSTTMIVAPYQDGSSLQFRIVNRRANNLIDLNAQVTLMTVDRNNGGLERKFAVLDLERSGVVFFPLTWTVVHPIVEGSPLLGKTAEDLKRLQAEVIIVIRGFDDTFSQTVHSRYSYRFDEITWNAKFEPAFEVEPNGDLRLEVNRVSSIKLIKEN